ncbi:MAG: hypothetical protein WCW78_00730 [Candidatus Paceibacterota bacterium]|jgi:hypothetical protein
MKKFFSTFFMNLADYAMRIYFLFASIVGLVFIAAVAGAGIALVASFFLAPTPGWDKETFVALWKAATIIFSLIEGCMLLKACTSFFTKELSPHSSYHLFRL